MAKRGRPRRGSLQYWPRKRSRRIYTRISHWPHVKDVKLLGFAGYKAGMTHVQLVDATPKSPTYGKTVMKPATIIDAPSLFVLGYRLYKKSPSGLVSVSQKISDKIPKELNIERKSKLASSAEMKEADDVRLIVATQPQKSGMRKQKPEIFEIAVGGEDFSKKKEYCDSLVSKEVAAGDVLKPGEFVDASAVTKGHGFMGPVKRYGIRIQTRKDKQMHRHVGSIGSTVPRHVDWRVPAAGQYGFFHRTELNKKVLLIDSDGRKVNAKGGLLGYGLVPGTFILIEGSVPGPRKRLVRLRRAVREQRFAPAELKYISTDSKQGK